VVWSATSEGYSLKTQLIVSAIIGAIAAAGLTWALWEIREKENSEKPRGDEAHASATTTQSPTPPPRGPTPEANSDVKIGAPGATSPVDPPSQSGKAEMGGIVDIPDIDATRQADGGIAAQPSNPPITRTFPPPTGEFQSLSDEQLKQRASTIAADLRIFQQRFSTALQERPEGPEAGLTESSDHEFYEKWKTEYETKHIAEAYSLVCEYFARGHSITPSAEMEASGGNILFQKSFEGPDAALRVAAFLDRLAND
jgi:hypothetical protein